MLRHSKVVLNRLPVLTLPTILGGLALALAGDGDGAAKAGAAGEGTVIAPKPLGSARSHNSYE